MRAVNGNVNPPRDDASMGAVSAIYEMAGFVDILAVFHPHPIPLPKRERAFCDLSPKGRGRKSSRAYRKFNAIRFPPRDDLRR